MCMRLQSFPTVHSLNIASSPVVNNQIKKSLLLSLRVKKLQNNFQSYQQKRDCLVHFLRLLAVCWPGAQSALDLLTVMFHKVV